MSKQKLTQLRNQIDELDKSIQSLIEQRAQKALLIAKVKKQSFDTQTFYRPEREAQILKAIIKRNKSPLKDQDISHIFREIMSACLALEQPLSVAYLGPKGTFTQEATFKHFGQAITALDCANIDEIFHQVEKDNVNYGVVPIENSSNGIIGATVDLLYSQNLNLCGEIEMAIHHQLMSLDKNQKIQTIYAHQQALDQCRKWLSNHYPDAQLKPVTSNALAAKIVQQEPNTAAIASNSALNLYNLQHIAKNIEDKTNNITRFLVLGKQNIAPSGNDKTSLLIVSEHKSGALLNLLMPFKERNINLLKLSSHPSPEEKWHYLFLLDICGHQTDKIVQEALQLVQQKALKLNILGSYPIAVW